jgi:hypothetical protein
MALIFESRNFIVEAVDKPLVDRNDGGHISISPKVRVADVQRLEPEQAIELIRLMMVVGQAMMTVMNRNGVDVGRINYQDNGNWGVFKPEGPYQHTHLYGRAKSAKYQKYGQACYFPHIDVQPEFYEALQPLTGKDIADMHEEMAALFSQPKYADTEWGLPS